MSQPKKTIQDESNDQRKLLQAAQLQFDIICERLEAVNTRLKSAGFSIWESIGLGVDSHDLSEQDFLSLVEKKFPLKLSKEDLIRYRELLEAKKHEIQMQINSHKAALEVFEAQIRAETLQAKQAETDKKQESVRTEFKSDPVTFLETNLYTLEKALLKSVAEIYTSADLVIAISSLLDQRVDQKYILEAWQIVYKAYEIAYKEHEFYNNPKTVADLEKYTNGAKIVFSKIQTRLPVDLQLQGQGLGIDYRSLRAKM